MKCEKMKCKKIGAGALVAVLLGVIAVFVWAEKKPQDQASEQAPERVLYSAAPVIELQKISEFYNPEVLSAAQGIRIYEPSEQFPNGVLAMASGYLNGSDLYDLSFTPIFTKPYNDAAGNKTLFADVVRLDNGNFAYTDFKGHRVIVMDAKGNEVARWGEGDLNLPIGIDQFDDGRVFVVDYGNDKLRLYSPEGALLKTVDSLNDEALKTPYDVRIHDKKAYLVDRTRHRILVLDEQLNLLSTIEKSDQGDFYFNHPQHIDFDSKGRLYVMDTKSKSIKIVNPETGLVVASLTHPDIWGFRGIAIDHMDRIYLAGFKTGYPAAGELLKEDHAGIIIFEKIADTDIEPDQNEGL